MKMKNKSNKKYEKCFALSIELHKYHSVGESNKIKWSKKETKYQSSADEERKHTKFFYIFNQTHCACLPASDYIQTCLPKINY